MKFKAKPKVKIKIKRGLENINFILYKINKGKNTEIGNLEVDMSKDHPYHVVSAHVNERYRNNGFGKKMYEYAIAHLGKLKTHYMDASEEAQYVWLSLHKKYKSRKNFFKGTLTLYNKLK